MKITVESYNGHSPNKSDRVRVERGGRLGSIKSASRYKTPCSICTTDAIYPNLCILLTCNWTALMVENHRCVVREGGVERGEFVATPGNVG